MISINVDGNNDEATGLIVIWICTVAWMETDVCVMLFRSNSDTSISSEDCL